MAREIFPMVRARQPHARLILVGHAPPASVTELAHIPGVEVLGYVEDLMPILKKSEVFVVPLLSGSGIRVKILDAFAWGIPVVSSQVGFEGIDARAEEHLLVADATRDFAEGVLSCLENPKHAMTMARRARKVAEERYAWPEVDRFLDKAIEEALCGHDQRT